MSTEAVAVIWIGGAALNGVLIWTSVGLSRFFGHAGQDAPPEPANAEAGRPEAQDAAAT